MSAADDFRRIAGKHGFMPEAAPPAPMTWEEMCAQWPTPTQDHDWNDDRDSPCEADWSTSVADTFLRYADWLAEEFGPFQGAAGSRSTRMTTSPRSAAGASQTIPKGARRSTAPGSSGTCG